MTFTVKRAAAVVITIVAVGLGLLVVWWVGDEPAAEAPETGAPVLHLLSPADGAEFVESDVMLRWSYAPVLASDHLFAVRVWQGDSDPHEVWTAETALGVQAIIDSFMHEVGPYYWQVAVIEVAEGGGFAGMVSDWSAVYTLNRVRRLSLTPVPAAEQSPAAQMISAQAPGSAGALIDTVRDFVSTNSDDTTQDRFDADYRDALDQIATYAAGEGERPRLLCDGQATAALTLLTEFGVESRLIFLYQDNHSKIQEHTLLEVFNPDRQQWELHDVLSNVYFVDENGDRASIERLVFGAFDLISVCTTGGDCLPIHDAEYGFTEYFEAFRYGHTETFWVNPDRFDVTKRFSANEGRNLAEYLTGDPRDFAFRFDNWIKP